MAVDPGVLADIEAEFDRSARLHHTYPADDLLRCAALVAEECGEMLQAALDVTRPPLQTSAIHKDRLYRETCGTAVMAIKLMMTIRAERDKT